MVLARTDLDVDFEHQSRPRAPRTVGINSWNGTKLLLAQEVAEILKIPLASVYDLARRKLIPSVRVGRLVRFEEEALRAWIATGGVSLDPPEEVTTFISPNTTQILARGR